MKATQGRRRVFWCSIQGQAIDFFSGAVVKWTLYIVAEEATKHELSLVSAIAKPRVARFLNLGTIPFSCLHFKVKFDFYYIFNGRACQSQNYLCRGLKKLKGWVSFSEVVLGFYYKTSTYKCCMPGFFRTVHIIGRAVQ